MFLVIFIVFDHIVPKEVLEDFILSSFEKQRETNIFQFHAMRTQKSEKY